MGAVTVPAAKLISVNVILLALATGAVTLRIISTQIRQRKWQTHDFLCVFSLLNLLGYVITLIVDGFHGAVGLHVAQVPLAKLVITLKIFFVSQFFWSTSITCFRLAILFLYMEIFRKPAFLRTAVATAVVVSLYYVACILMICLFCRPINYNWDKMLDGKCANTKAIELFSAAFNMVLDIWVVCLPLLIVWQLQMPKEKKIGISATFALGLANAGINLGRFIQTIQCPEEDFTYCFLGSAMLVVAEMSTGILVACVPTLGPIFFSNRLRANIKARYQLSHLRKNRRTALRSGSTLLTTLGDPASDVFDEQQFTTLDEPEAELQDSLKMGSHYQVHTGHPVVFEKPKRPVDANGIGIRKDFHVFETPKRG